MVRSANRPAPARTLTPGGGGGLSSRRKRLLLAAGWPTRLLRAGWPVCPPGAESVRGIPLSAAVLAGEASTTADLLQPRSLQAALRSLADDRDGTRRTLVEGLIQLARSALFSMEGKCALNVKEPPMLYGRLLLLFSSFQRLTTLMGAPAR